MKIEYLIYIDTKKGIATDKEGFLHLLQSNSQIKIDAFRNEISFHNQTFQYILQENKVNKENVVFHFTVSCDNVSSFSLENEIVKEYIKFFTQFDIIVGSQTQEIQVLWNDVNFHCSQLAYPMIYEIENLFRKLITKYMLVNVGKGWENIYSPNEVSKLSNSEKGQKREGGFLYKLDFIHIDNLLFGEKAKKTDWCSFAKKIMKFSVDKDLISISKSDFEDYIPKSIWDRFFCELISIDSKKLRENWSELYGLRNKIAHNNIFTPKDLKRVMSIVNWMKPSIEQAIDRLDEIKLDEEEKDISIISLNENLERQESLFDVISKIQKPLVTNSLKDTFNELTALQNTISDLTPMIIPDIEKVFNPFK